MCSNSVPVEELAAEAGEYGLRLVESTVYGRGTGPLGRASYAAVFVR